MSAIGPQLPPHLRKDKDEKHEAQRPRQQRPVDIGPTLPSHMKATFDGPLVEETTDGVEEEDVYLPALPPDLMKKQPKPGPAMLPPHDDSEIGPMPAPNGGETEDPVMEFLEREQRLRKAQEDAAKPKKLQREEWMLVPPTSSGLLGSLDPTKLKARQFSRSARPSQPPTEDMSLWTETPEQKLARLKDEVTGKRRRATEIEDEDNDREQQKRSRYEAEIAAQIDDYNRRTRGESLVDMHQSAELKDSSKEKEGVWDHARDMAIGGRLMDQQQRSKMIKDAHGLGERFGKGKSGFL